MTKLTDTQAIILSAASQRDGHIALPLPDSLRGGAATKVFGAMLATGLLEEVDADTRKGEPSGARPAMVTASRWLPPMQASPPSASRLTARRSNRPRTQHPRPARRARAPSRPPSSRCCAHQTARPLQKSWPRRDGSHIPCVARCPAHSRKSSGSK